MTFMVTLNVIRQKYKAVSPELDERSRRIWAASEATAVGHGGVAMVSAATGMAESTIRLGRRELRTSRSANRRQEESWRRIRKSGGGRKRLTASDHALLSALESLVEPTTRGDPMMPLRWTCKSTRNLAQELRRGGHTVSHMTVARLLEELQYSLQGTRKTLEGASHPDRNAQFEYINAQVVHFHRRGQPVISVDTKKKELIGDFGNKGKEYRPKGQPEKVRIHDFLDSELGKAIPYGVYDIRKNTGWVSVGVNHDTAEFAVQTIYRWWMDMGRKVYPYAKKLLITADGGGSNGNRNRLWKVQLQRFADKTGLDVNVCHFPPGTSKWNKIEHRMFSHITENWRGRPLISHEVIVNLIANTRTKAGLRIKAKLDTRSYAAGLRVTDEDLGAVNIHPADFHGENWNYRIKPNR